MKMLQVTYGYKERSYHLLFDENKFHFEKGKKYWIITDREYNNPFTVVEITTLKSAMYLSRFKTIVSAEPVDKRDSVSFSYKTSNVSIKNVYFNEEKRTTVVVWSDGIKTKLKCAPDDIFDKEKAIALAFMKRFYDNGGKFNDILKKYT